MLKNAVATDNSALDGGKGNKEMLDVIIDILIATAIVGLTVTPICIMLHKTQKELKALSKIEHDNDTDNDNDVQIYNPKTNRITADLSDRCNVSGGKQNDAE